ncbi:MAG: CshA/CshB family fibrillar adhesin-related protein [Sarcina sp.]
MADLNGTSQYASNGLYKDYIVWIELGNTSVDLLTSGKLTVENIIPDGYTINFDLSAKPYNNDPATSSIFTARPSDIGFGYLGKGITYNLPTNPYFGAGGTNFIISLENIIVKKNGTPITNYAFVVGDAEITTSGEEMYFYSPDAFWEIIDLVENHSPVQSPIISGVGTNTAKLTGVNYETGTYILQSYNVKNLEVSTPNLSPAGVVGAFGIIVKMPPELTKVATPSIINNANGEYVKFKVAFTPTDADILSYTLVDTLSQTSGISYIPINSISTTKTTLTQNGILIPVIETVNNNIVTFSIDSQDLQLNTLVELDLVYQLTEQLDVNIITNNINIQGVTEVGPTPKSYANATVQLKKVNFPKITKEPLIQEVLNENGEEVKFKIIIDDIKFDLATNTYKIVDQLNQFLEFSNANSTLSIIENGITTSLILNATVDANNLLTIIIPANEVPQNASIILDLVTTVKNGSEIPNSYIALNKASLIIDDDETKIYSSEEVKVLFVTKCFLALTDIIQSIASQEAALSHILNAEGEKIQKVLSLENTTPEDLLCINKSVTNMVKSITLLETILTQKLKNANKSYKNLLCKK